MPNYSCYYDGITGGSDWDSSTYYTASQAQQQYGQGIDLMQELWEEHQQMIDQQEKQAEELRKDKVNYPLFFLKEGIV